MYSNSAFAEQIDFSRFSIVEIDMTKNGVFEQISKYCLTLECVQSLNLCTANPKTIKLAWDTNKCLI